MLNYTGFRPRKKIKNHRLKQDQVTYTPWVILNFYTVYEMNLWPLTLGIIFSFLNSLFGAVKLTKHADPDKYFYSGYGTGFDTCSTSLLSYKTGFHKL